MTFERSTRSMRFPVLAVHFAALLGGVAFAWIQWCEVATQKAMVDQERETLDRVDARLTSASKATIGLPPQPAADPFLQGTSATLASANLQDRVVSTIRAAGGSVTSSQADTAGAGANPPTIAITVSFQLETGALQGLLYGLEDGTPALFIDQLSIDTVVPAAREPDAGSSEVLTISMTVSAYWNGVKP